MSLTLNQILLRLQKLAQSHQQINHYFVGDFDEFAKNNDVSYPALFVELKPNGTISKSELMTKYNFTFHFLDLVDISTDSNANEFEVYSDLSSIAQDFLAMLNFSDYQDDWYISQDNNFDVSKYKLPELCGGISVDCTIATRYASDRCQVPAIGVTFESPKDSEGVPMWYDAKYISNTIYKANGSEGNSVTISALKNRQILMVFQGDKLLETSMYSYDATTGTINLQYDLESEQVLQILNKNII